MTYRLIDDNTPASGKVPGPHRTVHTGCQQPAAVRAERLAQKSRQRDQQSVNILKDNVQ